MTDKTTETVTPADRQRVADHLRSCGASTISAVHTAANMPPARVAEYCRRLGDWQPSPAKPAGVVEPRPAAAETE